MAGIAIKNLEDHKFCTALCDVLQQHISNNVVIVRVEMMVMHDMASRRLMFWYSLVDEGLKARVNGTETPQHLVEVGMPVWNTHLDVDLVLAKFALVR